MQTRHYEDKEGKRVYITEVITERVIFIMPKGNGELKQTKEVKAEAFEFLEE